MSDISLYLYDLQRHDDLPNEFEFELSESSRITEQTDPGYLRDDIQIDSAKIFGLNVAEKIEQIHFYIGKREILVDYKVNQNSYMAILFFYDRLQPFINDVGSVRLRVGIQYQSREVCLYSGEIRLFSARVNKYGLNNYWIQNVNSAKSMMCYLYDHDPYFESLPPEVQNDISHINAFEKEREFYENICMHIESYIRFSESYQYTLGYDRTRPENIISSFLNIAFQEPEKSIPKAENNMVYKFACATIAHVKHRISELSCQRIAQSNALDEVPESVRQYCYSGFSDCIYEAFAEMKSREVTQLQEVLSLLLYLKSRLQALPGADARMNPSESIPSQVRDPSFSVIQQDIQSLIEATQKTNTFYLPEISKDILKHHISLDEIYEYYCLGRIIHSIISLGFVPDYCPLPTRHQYQISLKNHLLIRTEGYESDPMIMHSDASIPNTYYYHSPDESISITVYYQPVIHTRTNFSVNGINIYRYYAESDKTDTLMKYIPMSSFDSQRFSKNQIFTPDFLIKRESHGRVMYGILDAKWSLPMDARKLMPDILNKYYKLLYTINEETGCPQSGVPFLWVLAGKNYYSQKDGVHEMMETSDPIETNLLRFKPRYGTGVLPLTPEINSNALDDLLRPFLFGE